MKQKNHVVSDQAAIWRTLTGAFIISFSGVYVKLAHVMPSLSAFYRVFIGAICLTVITAFTGQLKWPGTKNALCLLAAGIFFSLDLFAWHRSIIYVGPGLATILVNFQVLILALYGVLFYKEPLTLRLLVAALMALTGLFLIFGWQWGSLPADYHKGVYWGFATAIFYAGFLLTLKAAQSSSRSLNPADNMMFTSWVAVLALGVYVLLNQHGFAIPDQQTLWALLGLGLTSQVLGWILITGALPRIKTATAGIILLIQPTFAYLWDILFFNLPLTPINLCGFLLAVGAIYLGTLAASD